MTATRRDTCVVAVGMLGFADSLATGQWFLALLSASVLVLECTA